LSRPDFYGRHLGKKGQCVPLEMNQEGSEMWNKTFAALICAACAGCSTWAPSEKYTIQAPADAYLVDRQAGDARVRVIRDAGATIGTGRMTFSIDGVPTVALDGSEQADFSTKPGHHIVCAYLTFFLAPSNKACSETTLDAGDRIALFRMGISWPDTIKMHREM
jgi:hypothetical protein